MVLTPRVLTLVEALTTGGMGTPAPRVLIPVAALIRLERTVPAMLADGPYSLRNPREHVPLMAEHEREWALLAEARCARPAL